MEKGNLSVSSENILPIIKKWLYSDTDIFLRELISNGSDAVNKLKKLKSLGEADHIEDEGFSVNVTLDEAAKTITISDNGIGMSGEEIRKYINQIAFSGAEEFMEKYKDREGGSEIIGHFGLGFYSAFMVADKVEIESLSYKEGEAAAHWVSDGGSEYELSEGSRQERGTDIILHVSEESKEFLSEYKLREIMRKYCSFMPVPVYFEKVTDKAVQSDTKDNTADEAQSGDENDSIIKEPVNEPVKTPINDTSPLWLKSASNCSDEEYKEFYRKVFMDFEEPLFWIHLNMDYPFRLKGILYFPKLKNHYETLEGRVKLYCNQVFVADNVKEVVPEFLLLLNGVMDCPDIPLNVSRSFLQNDSNVAKMSAYITRKVADKLNSLYKNDREDYCAYWKDIHVFIKYGCVKNKDFYEKITDSLIYKTINDEYKSLSELKGEETEYTLYYVSDGAVQSQYVNLFKEAGQDAVVLDHPIDAAFISYVESYGAGVKFKRIDSDISGALKKEETEEENEGLTELFKEGLNNDKLTIEAMSLKSENIPAVIVISEQSRRMKELSKMYAGGGIDFPLEEKLVLNSANSLVKLLHAFKDKPENKEDAGLIINHIYDLAQICQKPLEPEEMTKFVERSSAILSMLVKSKLD